MATSKSAKPLPARLPDVDTYILKAAPFAQPILNYVREMMHEAAPNLQEEVKWSRPFFVYQGIILGNMSAFKEHCSLGLWGADIAEVLRADGVKSSGAMGTFGRLSSIAALPTKAKLVAYVKHAVKLIDEGKRTKSIERQPRVAKPMPEAPLELIAALSKTKKASHSFEKLSPSCRREYIQWIVEAKRKETRAKRVATSVQWLAEGKPLHWKYEKPA